MQRVSKWLRPFSTVVMKVSPLAGVCVAGPCGRRKSAFLKETISLFVLISLGVHIMKYFLSNLRAKFETLFDDDRIEHCIYINVMFKYQVVN